jgi:hypothetical protein
MSFTSTRAIFVALDLHHDSFDWRGRRATQSPLPQALKSGAGYISFAREMSGDSMVTQIAF